MKDNLDASETLTAAANWLDWQDPDLTYGLKSAEDGLKLWRYWQERPHLCEHADSEPDEDRGDNSSVVHRVQCLGYDPLVRAATLAQNKR